MIVGCFFWFRIWAFDEKSYKTLLTHFLQFVSIEKFVVNLAPPWCGRGRRLRGGGGRWRAGGALAARGGGARGGARGGAGGGAHGAPRPAAAPRDRRQRHATAVTNHTHCSIISFTF